MRSWWPGGAAAHMGKSAHFAIVQRAMAIEWAFLPIGVAPILVEAGLMAHAAREEAPGSGFCWTVTDSSTSAAPLASTRPSAGGLLDSPTTGEPPGGTARAAAEPSRGRLSLLWWVFLANGAVLFVAFLLLAFSPIEISAPIALGQLALLVVGLVAMLALNFFLLRRVLAPFLRLTDAMGSVDPDRPGRRLSGIEPRSAEGAVLAGSFNAMLDRLERARREAARTALAAQEAERARVARELHDEIGQTLTAITIQAERAAEGDPALASRELGRLADAVRESLDEVRRIARELRPEALDDLGLINALIALGSRVDAQGGPRVRRELQGKLPPLQSDVELVIYRVAQESLTNALRHADAQVVTVSLAADAEGVTLSVKDDGTGMPAAPPAGTAGISGMRERALLVGGRLSVESSPDQGTEVRLVVPLDGDEA
jgi:two-component system sensor histidine kinase UhpB